VHVYDTLAVSICGCNWQIVSYTDGCVHNYGNLIV